RLEALPGIWACGPAREPTEAAVEHLACPGGFQSEAGPNQSQPRRLGAEDGRRAEGSLHFIISHVNDPQIALVPGALARNRENGMRVDRGHGRANDVKARAGEALAKQNFQILSVSV